MGAEENKSKTTPCDIIEQLESAVSELSGDLIHSCPRIRAPIKFPGTYRWMLLKSMMPFVSISAALRRA